MSAWRCVSGLAVIWATWGSGDSSQARARCEAKLQIAPDAGVQRQLDEIAQRHVEGESFLEFIAAMEPLRERARDTPEELFEQVLYYICRNDQSGEVYEEKKAAAIGVVRFSQIPKAAMAKVLVPYIYADDARLRSIVDYFLGQIEGPTPVFTHNFSTFVEVVRLNPHDPPLPLVRYMYEQDPGEALRGLIDVLPFSSAETYPQLRQERQQIIWAEHVVSNVLWEQQHDFRQQQDVPAEALAELEKLSRHSAWWVRLYVASIIRQHPQFAAPEMVERLSRDEHELVRQMVQARRTEVRGNQNQFDEPTREP